MPGLRILITAGPTREYFDSVRFISNPSTGKMGYALAAAARDRGHRVVLVSGPVAIEPPDGVQVVRVESAAEMAAAARRAFPRSDVAIFTAAVSDYRPVKRERKKLPKSSRPFAVKLEATEDIAASLGKTKGRRVTIGFAMEDHAARPHAERKLARKNCDAIVLNGPGNIGDDRARVELLVRGGRWQRWSAAPKSEIAVRLIEATERMVADRNKSGEIPLSR